MSSIRIARIDRIQYAIWGFVVFLSLQGLLSKSSSTILIISFISFILLNIWSWMHFAKIEDVNILYHIAPYITPTYFISVIGQTFYMVFITEIVYLSHVRIQTSPDIIQLIATFAYTIMGLLIGCLNFVPAIYRVQFLRFLKKKPENNEKEIKLIEIRDNIERYILSLKFGNLQPLTNDIAQDVTNVVPHTSGKAMTLVDIIELERWLSKRLEDHSKSSRNIFYVWGLSIVTTSVIAFNILASTLGVLGIIKSLIS